MLILKEKIRYPEKGDRFFVEKGEPEEIAWLHKAFQEFGSYADSYQNGALVLIDSALADKNFRDLNIYPAVFLIRHYLELRLKELIQGMEFCMGKDAVRRNHHDLQNLWSDFKKAYGELGEKDPDNIFPNIETLIKEITKVDPISMAFRYPEDTKGNKTQKLEHVNLTNLRETFIRVGFVFDGVAMQIANYVEITEDMMSDVYRNYW